MSLRYRNMIASDCHRLGVHQVCMVTITVDGKRFPDPEHVMKNGLVGRYMREFWARAPEALRSRFPDPTWWCGFEPQDGKRKQDGGSPTWFMHAHILLPAWNETGKIGNPQFFQWMRERGWQLSGRTTWGWPREKSGKAFIMPVFTAAGYATEGVSYAVKFGDTRPPGYLLDKSRLSPVTRSRFVSGTDPANIEAAERRADQAASESARQAECRRLMIEFRERREYSTAREFERRLKGDDVKRVKQANRSQRERIGDCGSSYRVTWAGQYLGTVDGPYTDVYEHVRDLTWMVADRMPDEYATPYLQRRRVLRPEPFARFYVHPNLAKTWPALARLLPESTPCPVLAEHPAATRVQSNEKPGRRPPPIRGCVLPRPILRDRRGLCLSFDGFRKAAHRTMRTGQGSDCVRWGGGSGRRGRPAKRAGSSAARRPILVKRVITKKIGKRQFRGPPP